MTLASVLLVMLTVFVRADLTPVYARHLRRHPLGAEGRAAVLAGQLERAAARAGVDVAVLAALAADESAFDHDRSSAEGALGALQLLPRSRWGRGWMRGCGDRPGDCEADNALWGAMALREGVRVCRGSLGHALGFYRAGRCLAGPRGRHTLAVARWVSDMMRMDPRRIHRAGEGS